MGVHVDQLGIGARFHDPAVGHNEDLVLVIAGFGVSKVSEGDIGLRVYKGLDVTWAK